MNTVKEIIHNKIPGQTQWPILGQTDKPKP
jgi:hypothetical protein